MKVVLIKYNSGNIMSVTYALHRLGLEPQLSDNADEIIAADKVIFPGVGEASSTMKYLQSHGLDKVIKELKQPVLGICLGMQLLTDYSEEGDTECIGVIPGQVKKFTSNNPGLKVPHVGWNQLSMLHGPLFGGIEEDSFAYFVHGYYVEKNEFSSAQTDYILPYSSAIGKDNFHAVQFHPEKSSSVGGQILKNFIEL